MTYITNKRKTKANAFPEAKVKNEQAYKYNGKEQDTRLGLNLYDYSARYLDNAIGRFTSIDPLAEKYYSISPYVYVANNPLKYIDPTGMSYTYNWNTGEYEHTDDDGKKRTVSQEEALKNSGAKHYNMSTSSGRNAFQSDYSLHGLLDQIGEKIIGIFGISETKKTPDGEKHISYTARSWENSGPDYIGMNVSGAVPNGLLLMTNTEIELNFGYLKKDSWVLYPTLKEGTGFNLSLGAQLTVGKYVGGGIMVANSMSGLGAYANYSRGPFSTSASSGFGDKGKANWYFYSVGYGVGYPKMKWSTQSGGSVTPPVHYLRDFRW